MLGYNLLLRYFCSQIKFLWIAFEIVLKLETLPKNEGKIKMFEYCLKTFKSVLYNVTRVTNSKEAVDRLALQTNYLSSRTYTYINKVRE